MKIGVVGIGVVGAANKFCFEKLGNDVSFHDKKYNTSISDVTESEIVYICVPTPSKEDGSCDTSIVESVIKELIDLDYKGIISIKSTVHPGTTEFLSSKYNNQISFCPEFLRERSALSDLVENQKLLAVGTHSDEQYEKIVKSHGHYPQCCLKLNPTQAEILKYMHNVFNAMRIIFANEFYDLCKALDVEYTPIKNSLLKTESLPDIYLDVNDNMRGFCGVCLPKDTQAMRFLVKKLGIDVELFDFILNRNNRLKKTAFPGMRE